jgi:molybdate transport system ATP-binding protein
LSAALLTGCKNISRVEKLTEHTLNAADWGIILKLNKTIPDNIRLIGIRAHYFKYTEALDVANTITCDVLKVIENPFSYIILLRNKDSSAENNYTKLRWEVDKSVWEEIARKGNTVRLTLEEENLLLLS